MATQKWYAKILQDLNIFLPSESLVKYLIVLFLPFPKAQYLLLQKY
jgi:hypothetical protein